MIWEDELNYLALDQWTREIPVVAGRGHIVDRNGELLAGNAASYSVFARANAVKDADGCAEVLSSALGISYEEVLKKLTDKSKSEISVVRHAEKSVVEKIEGKNLDGVYYARDNTRIYPYGDLACQLIGFTSFDQSGSTGVEQYYNKYLAGENGEILFESDLVGVDLKGATAAYVPATDGLNLKLTVDYRIQSAAEERMKKVLEESNAKGARCVVLDPRDGSVLAMVNLPSYDLNDIPRDDLSLLNDESRNRLVSDIYEPGSTFKIVTAAANIEETLKGNANALSLDHVYPSSRTRTVDGTKIKCWSDHANGKHSNQTLAEALNNSCNPCFVDIALSLGKETFYRYLTAFRFGKATGVDFSGEAIGMLLPESTVQNCDLARIGFGQTIAVTPLQLAAAAASAVNGGYYYAPRIVNEIYSSDNSVREKIQPNLLGRTVSGEASKILSSMLEGVVRDGSGKHAYIEGYRVAGKTGTAQKYENGVIAQGKYVSSFLGYFPANAPRYLALIIVDEPQGSYYGSTVAAPCAKDIFQKIIEINRLEPFTEEI
ncbi:MAG: penicillin-binding transpeptidase domain-containing protein [Clostridia bacterium]|nr:penicillin-binding transpeptidase domain-containing protein [Clostridia bacterium]